MQTSKGTYSHDYYIAHRDQIIKNVLERKEKNRVIWTCKQCPKFRATRKRLADNHARLLNHHVTPSQNAE